MKIQITFFGLIAFTLTACAAPASTPTPAPFTFSPPVIATLPAGATVPNLKGKFVFAPGDGSLMIQDASGGNAKMIFDPKDGTYADYPVFSPDGKQIAFSTSSVKPDGTFQYEIRTMDLDGANGRVVAKPENPKAIMFHPAWSADGKNIFFTQSYPVPPNEVSEIDRVSASGGAITKLIDEAREGEVSPDGKRIAFFKFDVATFASSLWVANVDASAPKMLVDTQTFAALQGARWSPDSQTILFSASGAPKKKLPGVAIIRTTHDDACAIWILFTCWVERAYAHGLPWDLWLVNLDGSKFDRLTMIGADSPYPAWSADGKFIAFYEASGIYLLDREKKTIFPISNKGGYGAFDWK